MKLKIAAFIATAAAALFAGVPLVWTVETSRPVPKVFDCYHGETLDMDAMFNTYGRQLDLTGKSAEIFWQTNGMGTAWWRTNATVKIANHVLATFTPKMDPGAAVVHGFLGVAGENYRGAFTLRFRNSPGAGTFLPLPTQILDFDKITVTNAPYYTKAEVDARTVRFSVTNNTLVITSGTVSE